MVHELAGNTESEKEKKEDKKLSSPESFDANEGNIWTGFRADLSQAPKDIFKSGPGPSLGLDLPNLSLNFGLKAASVAETRSPAKNSAATENPLPGEKSAQEASTDKTTKVERASYAESQREKANLNGSRLLLNPDDSIAKLTRKDGSVVDISYENGQKKQVVELSKDGNSRVVWTQNARKLWEATNQKKDSNGAWTTSGKSDIEYRDVSVNEQGITIARDLLGFMHVTTADGNKLKDGARYTFDEKGRVDSISYMPAENRFLKIGYDEKDKINKVEFYDGDGKLQETKTKIGEGEWQQKKARETNAVKWKGDIELACDGTFRQRSEADKAAGQWQVIAPFDTYTEKTSADGKQISRTYKDRTVELEKLLDNPDKPDSGDERISKVIRGKETREFRYDSEGKLKELVDNTAKGPQLTKTEGMSVQMNSSGDVLLRKPDRSAIMKKADFSSAEWDKDGYLLKVVSKEGKSRVFDYETVNNHKQLARITEQSPDKSGTKSQVWTAKRNSDGSLSDQFVTSGAGGKEEQISGVKVLYSGDFKYKTSDGKERISRISSDSNREPGLSVNVDEARDRLKTALSLLLDLKRAERLGKLMNEMEKRSQDHIERQAAAGLDPARAAEKWEKKLAQTYDHLAEMMEQNPSSAVYDRATRAKLVENFIWIAADTTRGAQDVGNCWQMSGRNLTGMQNNPEAMARVLKEVSLTGSFTALRGGIKSSNSLDRRRGDLNAPKKFTLPPNMLKLDRVNAGWSMDKPSDSYWQGGIGTMPSTPVGYILDNAIGYMGGRKSHGALSGGLWESFSSPSSNTREGWYYGINELMYMVTGEKTARPVNIQSNNISSGDISKLTDKRLQKQLLEHGGALLVGPGHMFAVKLIKNRGEWQIVTDNQWGKGGDQVIAKVSDLRNWTLQRTRTRYNPESAIS